MLNLIKACKICRQDSVSKCHKKHFEFVKNRLKNIDIRFGHVQNLDNILGNRLYGNLKKEIIKWTDESLKKIEDIWRSVCSCIWSPGEHAQSKHHPTDFVLNITTTYINEIPKIIHSSFHYTVRMSGRSLPKKKIILIRLWWMIRFYLSTSGNKCLKKWNDTMIWMRPLWFHKGLSSTQNLTTEIRTWGQEREKKNIEDSEELFKVAMYFLFTNNNKTKQKKKRFFIILFK